MIRSRIIADVADLSKKIAQVKEDLTSLRDLQREIERVVVEHGGSGAIEPGYEDS